MICVSGVNVCDYCLFLCEPQGFLEQVMKTYTLNVIYISLQFFLLKVI